MYVVIVFDIAEICIVSATAVRIYVFILFRVKLE